MSTIKIGGAGVHNDSGEPAHLHIGLVEGALKPTSVFDIVRGTMLDPYRSIASNINEAQASEIIDALAEVFPKLAGAVDVSSADLNLRAAARAVAGRLADWDRIPREEVKALIAAVKALYE